MEQNQSDSFQNEMNALTVEQCDALEVNDKIDHCDNVGRFLLATVVEKRGNTLKIHYDGWSRKWDCYSDYSKEAHRFAKAGSISKRPAHRLHSLDKGDCVDICIDPNANKDETNLGWKTGRINNFDSKSGQVQIVYNDDITDSNHLCWVHLDCVDKIEAFGTKVCKEDSQDAIIEALSMKNATEVVEKLNNQLSDVHDTAKKLEKGYVRPVPNPSKYSYNYDIGITQLFNNYQNVDKITTRLHSIEQSLDVLKTQMQVAQGAYLKGLEENRQSIKEELTKHKINWPDWGHEDIFGWFKFVCYDKNVKINKKQWDNIQQKLKIKEWTGNYLVICDENELTKLGFKNEDTISIILSAIKKLTIGSVVKIVRSNTDQPNDKDKDKDKDKQKNDSIEKDKNKDNNQIENNPDEKEINKEKVNDSCDHILTAITGELDIKNNCHCGGKVSYVCSKCEKTWCAQCHCKCFTDATIVTTNKNQDSESEPPKKKQRCV